MTERGDTPEETRVVRSFYPAAELMSVSIDKRAGRLSRYSGFGGTWTARHRRPPSPPPAALHEARLNGFPGALAEVLRHRVDAGSRRLRDTSAADLSGTA